MCAIQFISIQFSVIDSYRKSWDNSSVACARALAIPAGLIDLYVPRHFVKLKSLIAVVAHLQCFTPRHDVPGAPTNGTPLPCTTAHLPRQWKRRIEILPSFLDLLPHGRAAKTEKNTHHLFGEALIGVQGAEVEGLGPGLARFLGVGLDVMHCRDCCWLRVAQSVVETGALCHGQRGRDTGGRR